MNKIIQIGIIEDDKVIGNTLRQFLDQHDHVEVVHYYQSIEEVDTAFKKNKLNPMPEIVLLDIVLPGMSGITGIKSLKKYWPQADVIMFSVMDNYENIFDSLCEGAVGYITKDLKMADVLQAVEDVASGKGIMSPSIARKIAESFHSKKRLEVQLSPREIEIVHGIIAGLSYKLLGEKLGISIDTVRKHIKSIYKKLQINSKAQLMNKFYTN
jgi:DNA-binding NarL/FixJ family response regulator